MVGKAIEQLWTTIRVHCFPQPRSRLFIAEHNHGSALLRRWMRIGTLQYRPPDGWFSFHPEPKEYLDNRQQIFNRYPLVNIYITMEKYHF
jgi:hypothetical protein